MKHSASAARHLCAFLLLLFPLPLEGRDRNVPAAIVVDGDTLKLNGTTYRIHGIDAPELAQTCENGWLAGAYAAGVLRGLTDRGGVTCIPKTTDRYGRTVAVCWVDGVDLGAEMVRQGVAHAFTRYSNDYALQEAYAKAAGLGIHGANCRPAWQWRAEKR